VPEVVGDAAVLLDDASEDALAAALRRLLTDPAATRDLRARGLARTRRFSWETAAAALEDVYLEALGTGAAGRRMAGA
jgi:glycosyltransferase involved in cell wall biosynthesis